MAKWANDLMMDAALDYVAGATVMLACTAQPTDRANALSIALADVALAGGDFTKANGDTNGRKAIKRMIQHGFATDLDQGFGDHIGDRPHALAKASRQHHGVARNEACGHDGQSR